MTVTTEAAALLAKVKSWQRKWTSADCLEGEEYDFGYLKPEERKAAWCWEIDRECFWEALDKPSRRPFAALTPREREDYSGELDAGTSALVLLEIPLKEARDSIGSTTEFLWRNQSQFCSAHLLRINWAMPRARIIEAFSRWLDARAVPFLPRSFKPLHVERKGRNNDFNAWMKDLTVYRVSRRHRYTTGKDMLAGVDRLVSQSKWCDAIARVKRRIKQNQEMTVLRHYWSEGLAPNDPSFK